MLSNLQLDTLVFTFIMPWYVILQDISLAVSCRLVLQIFLFGDLLDVADVAADEVGVEVLDHVGPQLVGSTLDLEPSASSLGFGSLVYLISELSLNSSAQLLARLMSRVTPSLIMELMLSQSALLPMLWLSAGLSMPSSSMLLPTLMALAASLVTNP